MNDLVTRNYISALLEHAGNFGIDLNRNQCELLLKHLSLVLEANKTTNLTRITQPDDALILHILDSLLFTLPVNSTPLQFVDIGTGGGYPGIPLAIALDAKGTLLDSSKKKCEIAQGMVNELGLSGVLEVCSQRAEELAKNRPYAYDLVVARAVAETRVLIEYAAPLLKLNGILVVGKSQPSELELDEAYRAAELCGMDIVSRETFELPYKFGTRTLIKLVRSSEPVVILPRRNGMAVKKPLTK